MNTVFFNEYIQTSPKFMTDFTPWTLFVDTGIISVLLLLGKLMRVKISAWYYNGVAERIRELAGYPLCQEYFELCRKVFGS